MNTRNTNRTARRHLKNSSDNHSNQSSKTIDSITDHTEDIEDDKRRKRNRDSVPESTNLKGDYLNICLLLLLYLLQGIPVGLCSSIPYLLTNRGATYSQQALFSFAIWPFSCKLLWAPIVDSLYWPRFGRRKSWMVPSQYLIGLFMIVTSYNLDSLINPSGSDQPNIYLITGIFIFLNFLAATQDIAVDGWALTMLKPRNVGYASTCNTVGQTSGYFLGFVLFLILESPQFANYFRTEPKPHGFISLHGFFFFWGIVFFVITTLVMIFKNENSNQNSSSSSLSSLQQEPEESVKETYLKLIKILKLKPVQKFALVLLTCKIGFAVTDVATGLKLKEAGLTMDQIAMLAIPMLPMQLILPWLIGRYTNGPRPLDVFLKAYPYRLVFCFILAWLVYWTKSLMTTYGYLPYYYYIVLIIIYAGHQITIYSIYVALMAFHAKISDPTIGGTYMTLLNTITNLGGNWPGTVALWLLDHLSWAYCSTDSTLTCSPKSTIKCPNEGKCEIWIDGYYLGTVIFPLFGLLWLFWGVKHVHQLQTIAPSGWRCRRKNNQSQNNNNS